MRRFLMFLAILLVACQAQPPQTVQPTQAVSPSPARVYVEPATLQLQVGQSARVRVMIENVQNLRGVELHLTFDPALLDIADDDSAFQGTQITLGDFLAPEFVATNTVEQGKIDVAFLQTTRQTVSGPGRLIEFGVTGRAAGISVLTLDLVNLADSNAAPLPAQIEHGQITVLAPQQDVTATIPSVPTQTPTAIPSTRVWLDPPTVQFRVGQSARARVMIENVQDLAGIEFHLTFDPALLEIADDSPTPEGTQITLGDFLAPEFVAVNKVEQGKIDVAFLQLSGNAANGSGQVAAFTIRARKAGIAALTFIEVMLADSNSFPIPVRIESGQISIE